MGGLLRGSVQLRKVVLIVFVFSVSFSAQAQQCVSFFESTREISSTSKPQQLKIGTYNLLNLYMHTGNIRKKSGPHDKPRWAIEQMGKLLREENYDVFAAQEVESLESARTFNRDFLNNQYRIFSTTTKDVRGLFVVFFVKKDLPYHFKIESHAQEKWFDPHQQTESLVFERDLPTLHIYQNRDDVKPLLTMLGVHFKSKRDRTGDPESNRLRGAQVNRTVQIIQRYQIEFGYDHKFIVAGDFNNNHNFAPEFVPFLRHAKLSDTLGLKSEIQKYSDRTTHSYFGGERPSHNQLDGILVSQSLTNLLLDAYVVKYRDKNGNSKEISRTKEERKANPSDHRPITAIISVKVSDRP